jgi:hypothetical protein
MKAKFLLPNKFKKIGIFLMPTGLIIWALIQCGTFDALLLNLAHGHLIKVLILSTSFFSFLFGFYFIIFSKEKVEDEFINVTRVNSFQVAALSQVAFFILSFIYMFVFKIEPSGDSGLVNFLLASIIIFWLVYILYFNLSLMGNKVRVSEK